VRLFGRRFPTTDGARKFKCIGGGRSIHREPPFLSERISLSTAVRRVLPPAYRGARVISTDTIRISLVLKVSSRDQERE
jgi:hypothetical protein